MAASNPGPHHSSNLHAAVVSPLFSVLLDLNYTELVKLVEMVFPLIAPANEHRHKTYCPDRSLRLPTTEMVHLDARDVGALALTK